MVVGPAGTEAFLAPPRLGRLRALTSPERSRGRGLKPRGPGGRARRGGWAGRPGRLTHCPVRTTKLSCAGEITHLQGIIDGLVVLAAGRTSCPPPAEQVRPSPGAATPWLGTTEEAMGKHWGDQLGGAVGSRGTCPHEQGVCPGPSGASHRSRRLDVPDPQGQAPSKPVLMVPPASMPTHQPHAHRAAAPVAALPTSQHHAPTTPGGPRCAYRSTPHSALLSPQPYAEPSPRVT